MSISLSREEIIDTVAHRIAYDACTRYQLGAEVPLQIETVQLSAQNIATSLDVDEFNLFQDLWSETQEVYRQELALPIYK